MIPEPITREEKFLKEIYDAASGGGSAGHLVGITVDENYNLVSDQVLGQIYDWLDEGDNVTLHFQHPDYAGYWYDLPITARGSNGENFFLAAQLVDPYSSALSLLWARGSGSANEWTMTAYPVGNS